MKFFLYSLIGIVAGGLIVFFTIPYLQKYTNKNITIETSTDDISIRKTELLNNITTELLKAVENKNWRILYDSKPDSFKKEVSYENYLRFNKFDEGTFTNISDPTIIIEGDLGKIEINFSLCSEENCIKDNESNHIIFREYKFENGSWSSYDREPSKESLEVAASYLAEGKAVGWKEDAFIEKFGGGSNSLTYTIRLFATTMDQSPETYAIYKAKVENMRNKARQPVVNYSPPDINVETPSYVTPSYQNNSMNCTSNKIGNYTYTNCY